VADWFRVHGPVAAKVFEDYSGALGGPDPSKLVVVSQDACQGVADDLTAVLALPPIPDQALERPWRGVATRMHQAALDAAGTGGSSAAKALYDANAELGDAYNHLIDISQAYP
jgi:hypothetical protein